MTARSVRVAQVAPLAEPIVRFVPSPFVRSALHGDRTILLDLRRERYYGLDEVGTRVWALLREGADVPALVARLDEEYHAPRERLQADVAELLRCLSALQVIVPASKQRDGKRLTREVPRAASNPPRGPLRVQSGLACALALVGATLALRVLGLRRSLALFRRGGHRAPAAESPSPEFFAEVVRKVGVVAALFPVCVP